MNGVGRGFAAFGAGAAGGWMGLYPEFGGWQAGGAITGATNAWLSGATGNDVWMGAGVGAISSTFGGAFGVMGQQLGSVAINGFKIASPVIKSTITGLIGGYAGGYVGGFVATIAGGGTFDEARATGRSSGIFGASIGAGTGFSAGYKYAKDNNLNPWNGRPASYKSNPGKLPAESYYRAMSESEYNDYINNGLRPKPNGNDYQKGKLLYKSYQDAVKNTAAYDARYNQSSIIVEIQIPSNSSVNIQYYYMDGFDVIFIDITELPTFNKLILNKPNL